MATSSVVPPPTASLVLPVLLRPILSQVGPFTLGLGYPKFM